jgi:hypothetical protein
MQIDLQDLMAVLEGRSGNDLIQKPRPWLTVEAGQELLLQPHDLW